MMKNWSPNVKIGFISALLVLGPFFIGAGQYVIIGLTTWFPSLDIIPLGRFFLISGGIELIIGYLMGDAFIAEYRHRTKNFTGALPLKEQETVRMRRWPLYIAGAVLIIIGIVAGIVFMF